MPVPLLSGDPLVEETVLVTGGCGFVGQRMVSSLKADGHSVRVLDIPRADFTRVIDMGAKVLEGSVVDGESVRVALGASRVVYHMAAPAIAIRDERFIRKMVVAGAEVLMEEAEDSRVEHVVAASTTGVYARTDDAHSEDSRLKPGNRLERAKLDMERALEKAARRTGVGVTVLRLPNVYGVGDGGIVDRLVPEVVYEGTVILPERGWVSCVHVDDVVDASRRLASSARASDEDEGVFRVWNCVDDQAYSTRDLLRTIARLADASMPQLRSPGLTSSSKGRWAIRDRCVRLVERGRSSNAALKEELEGWPGWPSLEDGLPGELGTG
ncbi:MAG: NAD-dependent epimerase/dehydratase family protein [Thermoplasmata archaeon]|nr:NAD(P)-dependent oxidoreductase [Thermoplasmata archaeon]NIV78100.1 NAD-dependent epimerase/dehydratase family protein [Thermoplasmata archaeon]NIW81950.1 NAD-dependent epimerase/dehydratase family protein [Thermoplasmata archaeon]